MLEDILRDTWFYQKLLKEGREIGVKEGIEIVREEERQQRLQRWHELLVGCVEAIFPSLVPPARRCTEAVSDLDALQNLTLQVVSTKDIDMARNHLLVALEEKIV